MRIAIFLVVALFCSSCAAWSYVEGSVEARDPSAPLTFTWKGGPVIPNAEITNIFWSSAVQNQPEIDSFTQSIAASNYITTLYEYSISGSAIGAAKFVGSYDVASTMTYFTEADVQTVLNDLISQGKIAAPNSNSLYQIYIDAATTTFNLSLPNLGGASCAKFCGLHYHFTTSSGGVAYFSIMADCPTGCQGTNSLERFTIVGSHEIVEAITDPYFLNRAWEDAKKEEVADACSPASYTSNIDGKTWQLNSWYSMKVGNCTVTGPSNNPTSSASSLSSFFLSLMSWW